MQTVHSKSHEVPDVCQFVSGGYSKSTVGPTRAYIYALVRPAVDPGYSPLTNAVTAGMSVRLLPRILVLSLSSCVLSGAALTAVPAIAHFSGTDRVRCGAERAWKACSSVQVAEKVMCSLTALQVRPHHPACSLICEFRPGARCWWLTSNDPSGSGLSPLGYHCSLQLLQVSA